MCANDVIDEQQLQRALDRQKQTRAFLGEVLLDMRLVSAADLGPYVEQVTGFPFVNLADCLIDIKLARLIPESFSRKNLVLVFAQEDQVTQVAMADPLNVTIADDLQARLEHPIQVHLAFEADLLESISRVYRRVRGPMSTGFPAPASTMVLLNGTDSLLAKANSSPVFDSAGGIRNGDRLTGERLLGTRHQANLPTMYQSLLSTEVLVRGRTNLAQAEADAGEAESTPSIWRPRYRRRSRMLDTHQERPNSVMTTTDHERPEAAKAESSEVRPDSAKPTADVEGLEPMPSIWRRGYRHQGKALYASAIVAAILFVAFILGSVIAFYQAGNPAAAARCYSTLCCCLAAWMIGLPCWLWLEYFLFYRRWGVQGTMDQFKHGQQVTGAIWLGTALVLGGIVADNRAAASKEELFRAQTAQNAPQIQQAFKTSPDVSHRSPDDPLIQTLNSTLQKVLGRISHLEAGTTKLEAQITQIQAHPQMPKRTRHKTRRAKRAGPVKVIQPLP